MVTIICSQIELANRFDIYKIEKGEILLKPGKETIHLILEDYAIYQYQTSSSSIGVKLDSNVIAKIIYNSDLVLLKSALKYYILKLRTNVGSFIVGSLEYPAELSYSCEKNIVNLIFKVSQPL